MLVSRVTEGLPHSTVAGSEKQGLGEGLCHCLLGFLQKEWDRTEGTVEEWLHWKVLAGFVL